MRQTRRDGRPPRVDTMVGILILSHGDLARELLRAAETVAGTPAVSTPAVSTPQRFEALALNWTEEVSEAQSRVAAAIGRLDQGDGVLILTDMFGNTPSNVALSFEEAGKVEVVSGVNLPMVVRLACNKNWDMALSETAAWIRDKGKGSICCAPKR